MPRGRVDAIRSALALFVTGVLAALTACGTVSAADPGVGSPVVMPSPEDIAERARAVPGVDDVRVVYVDPAGEDHDTLAADPGDQADWVARIDLEADLRLGAGWASETVAALVMDASPSSRLEIWLDPTAEAEVSALAYPVATDGGDPVRDAYLMGATPGVVRAVFDGQTGDVRVRDGSDLAKVGDVAAAHGVDVERVRTADGASALDVATVPPRPPQVAIPLPWPDDPAAPDCAPDDLRLTIAGSDAATGHRALMIAATNTGAAPCVVEGYPALSFASIDERELDVTVEHGGSFVAQDPGAARVVIPAGARVLAVAGWDAMPTAEYPEGSGNRPDVTAEIRLAIGTGESPIELPLTSFALTSGQAHADDLGLWQPITTLDIVDGGEVTVTAWAPDGTSW